MLLIEEEEEEFVATLSHSEIYDSAHKYCKLLIK